MEYNLNDFMQKLTDFLKTEARTETVIGKSFQLGEFTCIPVIGMGFGLGAGGGEATANNKPGAGSGIGGGAGIGMGPIGFLVTKGSEIQFISVRQSKGLSAAFEKIPDLLEKFIDKKETQKA